MPTINDYKKKALNDAGYSGDINTAEWKWLKDICSPYVGTIPDMWRYALNQAGFSGSLPVAQSAMLKDLGYNDFSISNKWYKYWRDTPLEGVAWWELGSALDLDFANSRGFNSNDLTKLTPDSILTYTNPSAKMVYGSDGVLRYAPHNLVTYSENLTFIPGGWLYGTMTDGGATTDPNGGNAARVVTATSSGAYIYRTTGSTKAVKNKIWVKRLSGTGGVSVVNPQNSGYPTITASLTTSWQQFEIVGTGGGIGVVLNTPGDSVAIAFPQQNFTPCHDEAYIPTTTAAVYSLPIDHNPTTFEPLGVLIEEQRTNLLTYSEQFDDANWPKVNATVTANAAVAPNGTTTADLIYPTTTGMNRRIIRVTGALVTAAVTYTQSVYVKSAGLRWVHLNAIAAEVIGDSVWFDIINGVKGTVGANASSSTITNIGGGWFRISVSGLATATAASNYLIIQPTDNNGTFSVTANGTSGIYIWGAQLEAGAFATSYIPTVASQVTRLADQVSILTSAFGYNAAAGTMVAAADSPGISGAANIITVDDGTANERIRLLTDVLDPKIIITDGGVAQANIDTGAIVALQPFAMSAAYALNDIAACLNGGTVGTDIVATIPTVTTLRVGSDSVGNHLNGHIKRLTYFPTRRTNADLQGLST